VRQGGSGKDFSGPLEKRAIQSLQKLGRSNPLSAAVSVHHSSALHPGASEEEGSSEPFEAFGWVYLLAYPAFEAAKPSSKHPMTGGTEITVSTANATAKGLSYWFLYRLIHPWVVGAVCQRFGIGAVPSSLAVGAETYVDVTLNIKK
jgi:hypothetical protein